MGLHGAGIEHNKFRWQVPASRRHVTKLRPHPVAEGDALQQFECVGHAGEPGAAKLCRRLNESFRDHAAAAEGDATSRHEMRIEYREPVRVLKRQRQRHTVIMRQIEVFDDARRIGGNVAAGQSHPARAPFCAGCGEHHREVGVKRLLVTCAVLRCFPRAVCEGEADVWHEIAVEGFCGGGIARRQQSHGMARLERCKIADDEVGGRLGFERHKLLAAAHARCGCIDLSRKRGIAQLVVRKDQRWPRVFCRKMRQEIQRRTSSTIRMRDQLEAIMAFR